MICQCSDDYVQFIAEILAKYAKRRSFLELNAPMIISHAHKYIFFAMPKTATHSIREALREHLGTGDWEQQVLYGKSALPIPQLAAINHGHISVQQLKPHLPEETWNEYFKFSFVRDPYDRFVSTYFFLTRKQQFLVQDKTSHMKEIFRSPDYRSLVLVVPQHRLIAMQDGTIGLDYVARFEDIQRSYEHICSQIGIPPKKLILKNSSEHKPFSDYYDGELREMVNDFYRTDFEILGYDIVN